MWSTAIFCWIFILNRYNINQHSNISQFEWFSPSKWTSNTLQTNNNIINAFCWRENISFGKTKYFNTIIFCTCVFVYVLCVCEWYFKEKFVVIILKRKFVHLFIEYEYSHFVLPPLQIAHYLKDTRSYKHYAAHIKTKQQL